MWHGKVDASSENGKATLVHLKKGEVISILAKGWVILTASVGRVGLRAGIRQTLRRLASQVVFEDLEYRGQSAALPDGQPYGDLRSREVDLYFTQPVGKAF